MTEQQQPPPEVDEQPPPSAAPEVTTEQLRDVARAAWDYVYLASANPDEVGRTYDVMARALADLPYKP
jgi:bisphosphoglycerate-independent phosphoglycerate mutase (AlkP superfamily)